MQLIKYNCIHLIEYNTINLKHTELFPQRKTPSLQNEDDLHKNDSINSQLKKVSTLPRSRKLSAIVTDAHTAPQALVSSASIGELRKHR